MFNIYNLCIFRNNTTIPPDAVILEEVINDLNAIFHPKHYLIMQVKLVTKLDVLLDAKMKAKPLDYF